MIEPQKCIACMCQPMPECRNPFCPAIEPTGQGDVVAEVETEQFA